MLRKDALLFAQSLYFTLFDLICVNSYICFNSYICINSSNFIHFPHSLLKSYSILFMPTHSKITLNYNNLQSISLIKKSPENEEKRQRNVFRLKKGSYPKNLP